MTTFLLAVFSHTPFWVWGLLAALIALGLMQARDHVVTRPRVLIQPLALGAWSLASASAAFGLHAAVQLPWLAGLALGLAANLALRLPSRVQALADGRFAIGGSWAPLGLLMSIFVLRYVTNAALAVAPALAAEPAFAAVASLLYGLPSGLLAARAWRVLGLGRRASRWQTA